MRTPFCSAMVLAALLWPGLPVHADAIDDAAELLRAGRSGEAMRQVDAYLAKNPGDVRGRFLKGTILAEQQQSDAAIALFRALTEEMPEIPEPYNNLAVLYAAQGRYDEARRVLETAVLAHPNYALAHENLGDIYAHIAAQSYRRATRLDPKAASAQAKLRMIDQLLGK